jgi:NAD(P)-dependent dehydrogenase (short-subunit alcohol dehydrogenase family)
VDDFGGKSVLIAGGTSGIGASAALRFAKLGVRELRSVVVGRTLAKVS